MYTNKPFAQAVEYQRTLFENSYAVLSSIQEQGQQLLDRALESNPLLSEDSRNFYSHWADYWKQNGETAKAYVESSFDKMADAFGEEEEEKPKPAPKQKASKKSA